MLGQRCHIRNFYLLDCLPEVDTLRVLSLGVVDDDFDPLLVFCGFIWTPLCEGCDFDINNVAIEA